MPASAYRPQIAAMFRIAIPLALAELGWMFMSVADTVMVGRLPNSAEAIGAVSVGNGIFYSIAIFGLGMMSGLDALISHAFGANDWPEARRLLAAGLVLALCISPLLIGAIFAATPLLHLAGVKPEVLGPAIDFTATLVWSLPMLLVYTTFRRYLQGIHHVRPVAVALITSNAVNLAFNWLLIFGHLGFPALGVRGSALSTVLARIYLAAFLAISVRLRDPQALDFEAPGIARVRKVLALGWPAALTIGFEVGVFNTVTVLAGTLDAVSLAAHTIALNAAALTYMVPLGIGSAAAVSVGRALGQNDRSAARRAGWIAISLGVAWECLSTAIFLLLPRQIARIYTPDPRVIAFTASLFVIAAVFQLFDALQTVTIGALRGAGNTRTAMMWNLFGYGALGLPLGCWLCFKLGWGVVGLWDGLCAALMVIGLGLAITWHRVKMPLHVT